MASAALFSFSGSFGPFVANRASRVVVAAECQFPLIKPCLQVRHGAERPAVPRRMQMLQAVLAHKLKVLDHLGMDGEMYRYQDLR